MDIRQDRVIGYEALSRDAHGRLSILELFKKYQAVGQLSDLKKICFKKQIQASQEAGLSRVFINVDFDILSQIKIIPKPHEMEVILEISETEALQDVARHLQIAYLWRDRGYEFAIDDFGAGFVSLPFIAQLLPVHIKLDRHTLLQAVDSEKFRNVLNDLLKGLRNCSKEGIIAEGVENARELQVVKDLGIYLVQGFLLGKPEEMKKLGPPA